MRRPTPTEGVLVGHELGWNRIGRCREGMAAAGRQNKIHCHERTGRCEHKQGAAGTGEAAGKSGQSVQFRGKPGGKSHAGAFFGFCCWYGGTRRGWRGASRQSKSDRPLDTRKEGWGPRPGCKRGGTDAKMLMQRKTGRHAAGREGDEVRKTRHGAAGAPGRYAAAPPRRPPAPPLELGGKKGCARGMGR